jgi:protein O-mannosyl-transferase
MTYNSLVSTRRATLGAILFLTAAVYLPSVIGNEFVTLDDTLLITRNAAVHGLTWDTIRTAFSTYDPELYVPLTLLSYQIEYAIAGLHPLLYHLTNLLLHLGSTVFVFLIIERITQNAQKSTSHPSTLPRAGTQLPTIAMFVTLLFALHPLNTEAVVWAAARKDVLSGFLVLLSVLGLLKFRDGEGARWYGVSIAAFALALMAKVSVLLVPFSLVILDLLSGNRQWRKHHREYLPFALLALLFGVIALFGKSTQVREVALLDHTLIAFKAIGFYVTKFIFPIGLTVYQPQLSSLSPLSAEFLIPTLIVIVLSGAAIIARNRLPLLTFGFAWFLLAIAPSFLTVWKNGILYFASDRYVYIGGMGLGLVLGIGLGDMARRLPPRAARGGFVVAAVLLSTLSLLQSRTWSDSTTLYSRALAIHPTFAPAESNLGSSVYEEGDQEAAMEHYKRAIALDPSLTPAHVNIGILKSKSGDTNGALAAFRTAVSVIPADRALLPEEVAAYSFLGSLLDELGHTDEAIATFRTATIRAPDDADAHYNFAVTLQKYREHSEAREHFLVYLKLKPRDLEARYRLSSVAAEMGLLEEAVEHLEYIVDRDPQYEQAGKHLENIRKLMEE